MQQLTAISKTLSRAGELTTASMPRFREYLAKPHIPRSATVWALTFVSITQLGFTFGFGALGIGAGTWAAAIQSSLYAGATPAGGWFATMTSWGMLGLYKPFVVASASGFATVSAAISGRFGRK